jgi:hypothetical protein
MKSSIFGHIKEKRYSWASKREAVLPLFFWGLSSLRALGSNTAFLLGAQKHRFSFKRKAVFLGTQKREKVFDPRAAKLLRHKRKVVFLGTQKRRGI